MFRTLLKALIGRSPKPLPAAAIPPARIETNPDRLYQRHSSLGLSPNKGGA